MGALRGYEYKNTQDLFVKYVAGLLSRSRQVRLRRNLDRFLDSPVYKIVVVEHDQPLLEKGTRGKNLHPEDFSFE